MSHDTTRTPPVDDPWVLLREDTGEQFTLPHGDDVTLGREAGNDIVVDDPSVSRVHATFGATDQGVNVRDAGSTNGTSIDGHAVAGTVVRMGEGAEVRVGGVGLRLARRSGLRAPAAAAHTGERRRVPWLGLVASATAVVGAVIGVLTYLQSRPSPLAEYREQVATVCQAGAARQVKIDAAITDAGYDRGLFTELVAQAPATDEVLLHDLTELRPPDELAAKHQEAIGLVERTIAADRAYAASLSSLPDADFRRHWPDLPGDPTAWNSVGRQMQAALVSLSGGKCTGAKG